MDEVGRFGADQSRSSFKDDYWGMYIGARIANHGHSEGSSSAPVGFVLMNINVALVDGERGEVVEAGPQPGVFEGIRVNLVGNICIDFEVKIRDIAHRFADVGAREQVADANLS